MAGIEPATDGLRNRCSTAELHWPLGPEALGGRVSRTTEITLSRGGGLVKRNKLGECYPAAGRARQVRTAHGKRSA